MSSSPESNDDMNTTSATSLEEEVMAKATITEDANYTDASADIIINNNSNNTSASNNEEELAFFDANMDIDSNNNHGNEDDGEGDDDDDFKDATDEETTTNANEDTMALITKALTFKDKGNDQFKNKDFTQASRSYKKGINAIKHLHQPSSNDNDEQVTSLLISLQSNLSMVYYKLENYAKSKDIADYIIGNLDSKNSKAFYRRGLSFYKLQKLSNAKHDLYQALQYSPKDKNIIKEYRMIKKEYDLKNTKNAQEKEKQKKALARAFSSGSDGAGDSLLYNDREEELKLKQEREKEREIEEQKLKEKRKIDWENDCVQRMSNNQDVLTFEEYEKQLKDKEKEEEKARKKAKKEEEEEANRRRQEEKSKRSARKKQEEDDSSDDDILTEQELQSLRGYKKTSDGRTTSYFTREQTEEEKKLLGSIAPKKLDVPSTTASPSTESQISTKTAAVPRHMDSSISSSSLWNQAGTWEEKDTSEWCNATLDTFLKDSQVTISGDDTQTSTSFEATITKVKDLKGDASVAFVSGKKRFVFDYSTDLTYEIHVRDTINNDEEIHPAEQKKNVIAKGSLHLPDISSASICDEEIEVQVSTWKKSPKEIYESDAIKCRNALVDKVREQVLAFVSAFNSQY